MPWWMKKKNQILKVGSLRSDWLLIFLGSKITLVLYFRVSFYLGRFRDLLLDKVMMMIIIIIMIIII